MVVRAGASLNTDLLLSIVWFYGTDYDLVFHFHTLNVVFGSLFLASFCCNSVCYEISLLGLLA